MGFGMGEVVSLNWRIDRELRLEADLEKSPAADPIT